MMIHNNNEHARPACSPGLFLAEGAGPEAATTATKRKETKTEKLHFCLLSCQVQKKKSIERLYILLLGHAHEQNFL